MNNARIAESLLWTLLIVSGISFTGCSHIPVSASRSVAATVDFSPAASVSRTESIRIAEAYRTHRWRPASHNAFSGIDATGVHVQTPDIAFQPTDPDSRPGWWVPNESNTGIPYQWGGFDTPQEFDRKVAAGFYAGDIYTAAKRKALDDAVSAKACGIDCSGFISRCWRLDRSYSTRELASLCQPLPDFASLKQGDLVNKTNAHALLFVRFLDAEKTRFLAYETGSPPTWKVLKHPIQVDYVKGLGYLPYRYHHIRED
ncbi:MAG: hypothetical protein KDN22_09195 [Verrucomicrobiae bacterium]|nr:hypothetical protein [Verrucomicrobiae bacterium]